MLLFLLIALRSVGLDALHGISDDQQKNFLFVIECTGMNDGNIYFSQQLCFQKFDNGTKDIEMQQVLQIIQCETVNDELVLMVEYTRQPNKPLIMIIYPLSKSDY